MRRIVRRAALAIATLAVSLAPACTSESGPWVRPRRLPDPGPSVMDSLAREPLRVEYGGCATLLLGEGGLECVYEPGTTLRLWVMHDEQHPPQFAMEGGGAWSMGEPYVLPEELGQGYRLRLDDAGLGAVTVVVPGRPKWRLVLRAMGELSAEQRGSMRERQQRSSTLERQLAKPDLAALPMLRKLIEAMIADHEVGKAVDTTCAAAYHLTWKIGRPQLARELIDEVTDHLGQRIPSFEQVAPLEFAALTTYRGHALRRRGQLAEAAAAYRQSTRLYRRIDSTPDILDSMPPYALVLAELGYFEAAAYWSAKARDLAIEHARPYTLGQILTMVARVSLRLRQARQTYDDPSPRLDVVRRIYGPEGPLADRDEPFDALLSRAQVALLDGKPAEALAEIAPLRDKNFARARKAAIEEMWLRSHALAGTNLSELRRLVARLKKLATEADSLDIDWKVALLEARVHERSGDTQRAIDAYHRAEDLLDRILVLAALGLPGDAAAARHHESTQRLASLLVANDEIEHAVCTIRRSRARINQLAVVHHRFEEQGHEELTASIAEYYAAQLEHESLLEESEGLDQLASERTRLVASKKKAKLEQQALEMLSVQGMNPETLDCDALAKRSPGELLLVLYPDGTDLHVLVVDDQGATAYPTLSGYFGAELNSDHWNSDLLLHPFDERLRSSQRVRVLATGRANSIPVHALPWSPDPSASDRSREPLAYHIPVVYGLDLPRTKPKVTPEAPRALVLVDRSAEGTKDEAHQAANRMQGHGWRVTTLSTGEQESGALRELLERSDLFHYAGHAYYASQQEPSDENLRLWPPYPGGSASDPSYIPFGKHGKLNASDVLLMAHVPNIAVLMGCATGVSDERTLYGGFSLATAFLGAGADAVVASTHDIDGSETQILSDALYSMGASKLPKDVGRWMTTAIRYARKAGLSRKTLANYRVYVP